MSNMLDSNSVISKLNAENIALKYTVQVLISHLRRKGVIDGEALASEIASLTDAPSYKKNEVIDKVFAEMQAEATGTKP